jgi:NAD(P)-dependent dehydrogenase (short-subunit alcohol dehydrogenase family)
VSGAEGHGHLAGRVVLITGATSGIGRAATEALAKLGATVIVHGRDASRVAAVVDPITSRHGRGTALGVVADLASLTDVRRLAGEIDSHHGRLDALVNNAGLATRRRESTVDGFERQFAVNHLAPFLLTNLVLPKLKASAPARIVNVASNAHHRAAFDIDDLNWERRPYQPLGAYGATKLANILFTRELARRLQGTGVTANCLHPGVVATNIFTGLGFVGRLFGLLSRPFLLSESAGAETTVHLATAPALAVTSGEYFTSSRIARTATTAEDGAMAARLWQRSAELTGLAQ